MEKMPKTFGWLYRFLEVPRGKTPKIVKTKF